MIKRGPFGLEMGMRPEELSNHMEEINPGRYIAKSVPKPHSAFQQYVLAFSEEQGLYEIRALSENFSTSAYGNELQGRFSALKEKLEKTYGECKLYDFLFVDSIWDEPRDWMQSLLSQERALSANWNEKEGVALVNGIGAIYLTGHAISTTEGYLSISYCFENYDAAQAELAALEDDAL